MQVGAVSVIGDVDIVTPNLEVFAMERLADVTDELDVDISFLPIQNLVFNF